jgi:hypothetical protein
MKLEALAPLILRRTSGELRLACGEIFVLTDDEASILLRKVPGKVRVVAVESVTVEPAIKPDGTPLTPVYWERGDGSISGPASVDFFYRMGSTDGLIVTYRGEMIWINANQLRSLKAFLEQSEVREVDPAWRW